MNNKIVLWNGNKTFSFKKKIHVMQGQEEINAL